MKYAVIDISSGGLSFLVAAAEDNKTEILLKERQPLSLLSYMEGKKLSERGIRKLIDALGGIGSTCERLEVERGYLISTALLRRVTNYEEIVGAVQEKTGLPINYIDGQTEAYCDFAANRCYSAFPRAVLVDIGGKSVEICDLSKREKEEMLFLNFGLFDLIERFVKKTQPTPEEAKKMRDYLKARYKKKGLPKEDHYDTLVAVGPTAEALYAVYAEFTGAEEEGGEKVIRRRSFKRFTDYLLEGEGRSRLILQTAPERLTLILPAAILLKTLVKRFDLSTVVVSDRGVKEGFLRLVLDGREEGAYYDFVKKERGGSRRPSEVRAGSREKPAADGQMPSGAGEEEDRKGAEEAEERKAGRKKEGAEKSADKSDGRKAAVPADGEGPTDAEEGEAAVDSLPAPEGKNKKSAARGASSGQAKKAARSGSARTAAEKAEAPRTADDGEGTGRVGKTKSGARRGRPPKKAVAAPSDSPKSDAAE